MTLLVLFFLCFRIASIQTRVVHVWGKSRYSLTYADAYRKCSNLGGSLANHQDLEDALRQSGYSVCSCGWVGEKTAQYPISRPRPECGDKSGIHTCTWRKKWDAFCYLGEVLPRCSRPLGVEMGAIPGHSLTSSTAHRSLFGISWTADKARLNRMGWVNAWMPHHDGRNQYLEIDLGRLMAVSGIITQGAKRYSKWQYVTQYRIRYSKNQESWTNYEENDVVKIFNGNHDNNGHARNMFSEIFVARYVRVYPQAWHHHITLRVELLGCDLRTYDDAMEKKREASSSSSVKRQK